MRRAGYLAIIGIVIVFKKPTLLCVAEVAMKKGFTLIELLAVVLIMGMLSAIALPQYRRSLNRARVAEAESMLAPMYESRERWAVENGYPSFGGASGFNAKMLDIGVKGATGIDGTKITTANYEYDLSNGLAVTAKLLKGNGVKGTVFAYDGGKLFCCGEGNVCTDVFNFNTSDLRCF